MRYMIVAYDKNRVIGDNGTMPWKDQFPTDLQHFKDLTLGKTVVMGRKTYESIGHALPFRQNIVLTRQDLEYDDALVVHSLAHAYAAADEDVYVIGGAEVYKMALVDVDVIYATEIHASFTGDTFFPSLSDAWQVMSREEHVADERNKFDYAFVTYTRLH